ncbi:unnamed protein product [Paramecium octaurelia]|uniref:Mediator of RNA polymerase II transcription subunit 31 n=1 Tax=Paramecium octaurelia TaxID=43137 RepID=A0A8S1SIZ0_PAROT|nr:unnamed protein product [Paramecium octaurelia]
MFSTSILASLALLPNLQLQSKSTQIILMQQIYDDYKRFQMDLEFVQLLANPQYIYQLAIKQYFEDDQFVNYLQYLLYFKRPEFLKYIKYPVCIKMLDCLQNEEFRLQMKDRNFADKISKQIEVTFQILQSK